MTSKRLRALMGASAMGLVLMVPAAAATLEGQIVDSTDAVTLEGALVRIVELGRTTESGADGSYRFADMTPGTYTLSVTYAGADPVERQVTVGATTTTLEVAIGPAADAYGESVIVVGQRANLASSISRQRAADGVESVLTRDAIGQFPDQNVAESVRRAPGVNVLNDQGEGRFIAVRGLDPNLNAASINGQRIPAPESDIRAVALDVVPAELIESIEIKKTLTPDMDADTIGATIEINTTTAFDRKEGHLGITAEASYNDKNEKYSPKGAIDFSALLTDNFGVAGGVSYYKRKFSTDNVEAEGWTIDDRGAPVFEKLEFRDYDVERTRIGYTLGFDYKPDADTTLYLHGLHSIFDDQEYRSRLTFDLDDEFDAYAGNADQVSVNSEDGRIRVERDLKDRFERQKITSISAGGKTFLDAWTFQYSAAYSKASEKEDGSIDPIAFRRDFEEEDGLDVTFDFGDRFRPGYHVNSGLGGFTDPAGYEFDKLERTTLSLAQDEEVAYRLDVTRQFALDDGGSFDIQFGAKARLREKTYDGEFDIYDGYEGDEDLTLADMLGRATYGIAPIDPVPGAPAERKFLRANMDNFERDDFDSLQASLESDYAVDEDIYAGYLLGRYENGPLKVIGGIRVEHTENTVAGNYIQIFEEGAILDGVELEDDTLVTAPVSFDREYTDWLPSIAAKYDVSTDVVVRGGVYRSLVRPTPGQMAPRFLVEENDEDEREGEFGNPNLKPYKAWNADVSAEWYFAKNAVVSGGVFYKSIQDFIVTAEVDDVTYNGIFADEATIPINGDEADVFGVELNLQSDLDFLDSMLEGFLVGFNYTYTDATGDIGDREIPLPAASKNTYNAMIGYEKDGFSARVAATYRSGYLDELGGDAEEDRYVKDHLQWDVSMKYRVTPQAQVFLEFINIGDEPYIAYQKGPDREHLLQYEDYSWTGKAGVRLSF